MSSNIVVGSGAATSRTLVVATVFVFVCVVVTTGSLSCRNCGGSVAAVELKWIFCHFSVRLFKPAEGE